MKTVDTEMNKLINIGKDAHTMSPRCRVGNNIVDYFTFTQRLHTRGKYNVNFFEFVANIETFKQKDFIKNMLTYYENVKNKNKTKHEFVVLKEVYNICISAINIIRPIVYMEIYCKYNPTSILDFCAGWGGAAVAARALNIPNYIGIEINTHLKTPYEKLIKYLNSVNTNTHIDLKKGTTSTNTNIKMIFDDALNVNYEELYYDLVFTSPPYYFIQKYENNVAYKSKKEMDELFYIPLFTKTYNGLQKGGYYAINVCKEVYDNVLVSLFGVAHDIYSYKKSKRQNDYNEMVYVWHKTKI
jgi:16S rRNA G966 N2-methylase RsmD